MPTFKAIKSHLTQSSEDVFLIAADEHEHEISAKKFNQFDDPIK